LVPVVVCHLLSQRPVVGVELLPNLWVIPARGEPGMKPYYDEDGITIYCADMREVLPRIAEKVDLVLTDPPYSSGGMYRADRSQGTAAKYQHSHETNRVYAGFTGDNRDQRSFEKWCSDWMADCMSLTREGGVIGCFIDWRNVACVVDAMQMGGWVYRALVPWHKGSDLRPRKAWFRQNIEYIVFGSAGPLAAGPGVEGHCRDGLLSHRVNGMDKQHQTQKPVPLFAEIIGTRPDWQSMLDPFMGSGTTLLAARQLGRRAIGIEIDERNCEIAVERLSQGSLFAEAA
jgi:site-specific DNA-methyltransferase (adenine-specific)